MLREKVRKIFTPELLLAIFIFFIAVRFVSEVPQWFDIAQSDDNGYMFRGIHFFDNVATLEADWSPLYSLYFFILYYLVPDSTKIYYLGMQGVGLLLPIFTFFFLRRTQVALWLSAWIAVFLLASYALWIPEPRVTVFAGLVFVLIWWLTSLPEERWKRLWMMVAASLLFAYTRPEFFLSTLLLSVVAASYLFSMLIKRKLILHRDDWLFLGIIGSVILFFFLWWGVPFSAGRSIYAFGQHYAENVSHCIAENTPDNMPWEEILARDFGDAQTMGDVLRNNLPNFGRHLLCNLKALPKALVKVTFGSTWGSSWLIFRFWAAFIFYRLTVQWQQIRERFLWLWQKDLLLLPFFSLIILFMDVVLIYPREHYLSLVALIIWLLSAVLFAVTKSQYKSVWKESFVIGISLFLLMPSLGSLFDYKVPSKPVLETVKTIRALELDEPLRLFATQPFQPPRTEVYFDESYTPIRYKPESASFGEYIAENQPNVIVITKSGWHFRDDPTWLAFQEHPYKFDFRQLPFEVTDDFGSWWIYIRE